MERSLVVRVLVIIALGFIGGVVQHSVAAEPSGLHLLQSAIALGAAPDGSPIEVKTFYKNEDIRFYTKVSFDPARGSGGKHRLSYKWYTGDVLSLTFDGQQQFDVSPTHWWAYVHVSHFTPGHHRAELYIDDQLFASGEFDIKARERPIEPEEETAIKDSSVALLLAGDTKHFDELASRYRTSEERTASGTWKLSLLYNAIDAKSFAPQNPHWKELQDLSGAWLAAEPDSPTAVVLDARILFQHAWSLRGEKALREVPAQSRQLYQQLIQRARSVLEQHPNVALQDPEWDTLRISIAREQGVDSKEILAIAERALDRSPYFYPIHNAAVNALLPRWGGSRQAIQAYVKLALEHSRTREGTQAYARIYYYIARTSSDPVDDLNLMGAKWPPFKQSLAEILQKYPSSFNQDIARHMAFFASDAVAYRAYGRAATGDIIPVAWWDTREWRQQGNEWAFEGKHAQGSLIHRAAADLSFLRGEGPEFWQPVRWVAFLAIFLIECTFWVLDRLARRSTLDRTLSQGMIGAFNPFDYPRTYHLLPVLGRVSTRIGVWMLVFGAASAYLITTVPSPDPRETTIVIAGLITIAAIGAFIVANVFASRLILRGDDLEVRRLVGGSHMIRRNDILGIRGHALKTGSRILEVAPRSDGVKPLFIPPVLREDNAFKLWFASLPTLAEDREEVPEHSTG